MNQHTTAAANQNRLRRAWRKRALLAEAENDKLRIRIKRLEAQLYQASRLADESAELLREIRRGG